MQRLASRPARAPALRLALALAATTAACGDNTAAPPRLLDEFAPDATVDFPRDGQAVRTRRVLVRGTVDDPSSVASVSITAGAQTIAATVDADGSYRAAIELLPAMNEVVVRATDGFGNARTIQSRIFYGQRLASGGAHGGAIRDGRIYTWGRNNVGQTGLDYISHESRTTFCDRTQAAPRDVAWCKATTISAIDAICLNPGFVTPTPPDSPAAMACRAATRALRDAVCDAAGAGAPASCKTSSTANLAAACDAAYGTGTPASSACKASLVCDGAYAAASPERASCTSISSAVPSMFPSPAPPYAPVAIDAFSPSAAPAPTGGGVPFASLGVAFTALSFNQNASTALDSAGRVWSWGDGGNGMLCLGDTLDRKLPHRVDELGAPGTTAIAIARGYDHVLILRSDGSVWGCGLNSVGQLGDGTSGAGASRAVPTRVVGLPADIVQVLASAQSSYALTAGGRVYAWGRNQFGNLGNGTASPASQAAPTPALVPDLAGVVMIASGRDHVLAATARGAVYAWGQNGSNQVNAGDGDVLSPVQIGGIADARAVYANANQGFYENALGQLLGWGQNGNGNLGIPENEDQPAPASPVFGIASVLDVAIGALQGFALRGDQAFGWGWSFHGSLGAGPSAIHAWPYRTPLLVQLP
jgi:alpha-tubulin suppressor-like RCC1 family protein